MMGMGGANQVASLFVKVGADARQFENAMGGVDRRLSSVGGAVTKFGALVGAVAVGGVVALGAGLTSALRASAEFEKTISGAGAVLNATAEEMEQLSDAAMRIGKDTAFSASEAAGAIEMLAKNGLGVAEIMNGAADATVALAAATGANLATAADVATDAMAQFGIRAEDMGKAIDGITGVVVASKFGINDYALALSQGGGVAAAVGVSFEDFNATIAAISSAFGSGSDAGTSFKTFLQRLVPQSEPAAEMMMKLGLLAEDGTNAFFDATGGMKSMADIAGILQTAFSGLSDSARIEAFSEIFGTDAMRTAAKLSEVGSGGIADMLEAMSKVNATEQAAKRLDNLAGDVEQLSGSFDTLKISIGKAFTPLARKGVQWLTKQINRLLETDFNSWVAKIENSFDAISSFGKYFLVVFEDGDYLNDWLSHLPKSIKPVVRWFGEMIYKLREGAKALRNFVEPFVSPLKALIEQFKTGFSFGFDKMNLAGPLQGLFSALVDVWLKMEGWMIGTALPAILTTLGQWGAALVGWIAPQVPGILSELGSMFVELGRWFVGALPGIVAQLTTWGAALVAWIAPQVPALKAKLGEWTGAFLEWAGSLWPGIRDNLSELWGALTEWVTNPAKRTELAANLKDKWTGFTDWAGDIWRDSIAPKLGTAYDALKDWITDPARGAELASSLKDKWTGFTEWAGEIWEKNISPKLTAAYDAIKDWITDPSKRQATFQALKDKWTSFQEWASGVWGRAEPKLAAMYNSIINWIDQQVPGLGTRLNAWVVAFTEIPGKIQAAWETDYGKLQTTTKNFIDGLIPEWQRLLVNLQTLFGSDGKGGSMGAIWGGVESFLGEVFRYLTGEVLKFMRSLNAALEYIILIKKILAGDLGIKDIMAELIMIDLRRLAPILQPQISPSSSGGGSGDFGTSSGTMGTSFFGTGLSAATVGSGGGTININISGDGAALPSDRAKLRELARAIWREAELSGMRI